MRPPEPGATLTRYSGGAILFHWVIALMIVANILLAIVTDDWEGPGRALAMGLHKATGFTILVLSVLRIAWRLGHRPPPFPASVKPLEAAGARLVHGLFYVLMIAMPMSGWLMISAAAERRPFTWYGLFDLPFLPVADRKPVRDVAHEMHEILGYLMIALVVLHVAGALRHHFRDRNGFIGRIWPGKASTH